MQPRQSRRFAANQAPVLRQPSKNNNFMKTPLASGLAALSERIEELAASRDSLRKKLAETEAENEELKRQNVEMQLEIKRLRLDNEYLTVSHKLADNPQALADARLTLRHLIARVDKAIALINDDPAI